MKNLQTQILSFTVAIVAILLLFACNEEITGPDTVPVKAEIKQVIVNNSIYRTDKLNLFPDDSDTVVVTVPEGTDITSLDLDIIYSYFGSIEPKPGITDLTNPMTYTVTSNAESRDEVVMVNVIPPSITSFVLTSPVNAPAIIDGNTISLEVLDGIDLSTATFDADIFGASLVPDKSSTLDLTDENTTIKVVNNGSEVVYDFDITYLGRIEFAGIIYDGTILPQEFVPGSVDSGEEDGWVVEEHADAYQGSAVHFTSLEDDNGQASFDYGDLGLTDEPNQVTTILRIKGIDDSGEHFAEMQFVIADKRAKLIIRNDRIEIVGADKIKVKYEEIPGFTPTDWNIYRVTVDKNTDEVILYINEEPTPLISGTLYGGEGNEHKFGDGGGKLYECLFDYIVIDTQGAYSPEDLPLDEILVAE